MKSRAEAAAYARRVFFETFDPRLTENDQIIPTPDKDAWHWGKCEIKALMDFIYEGSPENADEEIWVGRNLRNR